MPWFWTDDLARALLEGGGAEEAEVQDWLTRPVAIRLSGDHDLAHLAARLLGREEAPEDRVAGAA